MHSKGNEVIYVSIVAYYRVPLSTHLSSLKKQQRDYWYGNINKGGENTIDRHCNVSRNVINVFKFFYRLFCSTVSVFTRLRRI